MKKTKEDDKVDLPTIIMAVGTILFLVFFILFDQGVI